MRFGNYRTSSNVEDRGSGGGFGGGGGGGLLMLAPMLIRFVFSRFGIVGVIVLFGLFFLLMGNPFGGGSQRAVSPDAKQAGQSAGDVCASSPDRRVLCGVLASTEDQWGQLFEASGSRYQAPVLAFYQGGTGTACGQGQSAMGPFYCPADQRIYLDTSFFDELARRHGAPGDFAQAYVIAHEVGHHVQTITGAADRVRSAQQQASRREGNALQVRMELQADCYAGVWAARSRDYLDPGDLEEGMTAAAAIGDDTLQRAGQGHVVPESFTHGTSAQRQEALMRGFQGGTPQACEGYTSGI